MKYSEFRRHLGKAGLTTADFAYLIKLNPNSITNYSKRGTVPSNLAVIATLMGHIVDNGLEFKEVLGKIDITPNKVRGAASVGQFGGDKQLQIEINN